MNKELKALTITLSLLAMACGCSDFANQDSGQVKVDQVAINEQSAPIQEMASVNSISDFRTLINFQNDTIAWKQVLKQAKKESKPILFYGWALWCQPCLLENTLVLGRDAQLAQFLNDNFISTRYMMETNSGVHVSEGWDIVNKYNVDFNAYPVFLFFDSKGKLVQEYFGNISSEDLMSVAQGAMLLGNKDKIK